MYLASVLHLFVFPGMACAFVGGLFSVSHNSALHKRQTQNDGFIDNSNRVPSIGDAGAYSISRRAAPRKLRAFPNEYEAFFNSASRSGADAITTLTPEERAQRALEGEKLEDEIIEIATVLREKADAMVADTGAINFEIIQPLIDEIAVLKGKYKLVVGATSPDDKEDEEPSS